MDIKKIKEIVNCDNIDDSTKISMITIVLSEDKNIIPTLLKMLQNEREIQKELLIDTNAELSRALLVLNDDNLKTNKKIIVEPKWVAQEIKKHYNKWYEYISCNFKIDGLIR